MGSIVLITVDCLRADHVGCYGYDRPTTPNVDDFAEDEATVFENAYANCPGTRWAFQTIHTGLWTNQIDGLGVPEADSTPVLAESLRENGHVTGGFANNGYVSRDYGYDRGFDTFYGVKDFAGERSAFETVVRSVDSLLTGSPVEPYATKLYDLFERRFGGDFEPDVTDEDLCDLAIEWITERRADDEEYFAWVHLMDAHTPYARRDDYLEEIRGDTDVKHVIHPGRSDLVEVGEEPPERVVDTYDTGVRSADEQIGRILDAVGDDDSVVITGDHGEEFGRFKDFHIASVYSSFAQVPMIVRSPSLQKKTRVETPAQHIDVPATVLFEAGIDVPEQWFGIPLQNVEQQRGLEDEIFYQRKHEHAIRKGDWKLVSDAETGKRELYNVPHMGTEEKPVENERKEEELVECLEGYLRRVGDKELMTEKKDHEDLSDEIENNLRDLGYLE